VTLTKEIRDQLTDFEHLARDLVSHPTSIAEIVPNHPIGLGPHDASRLGMGGGCWLPAVHGSTLEPFLWHACFPPEVTADLVSDANPTGNINNSQLELAGKIAHLDTLVQQFDCSGWMLVPLGDNIPEVAWSHKGSVTTLGATGYLLRLDSVHQRHFQYLSKPDYIAGPANQMADDCLHLWHLSDEQLLTHFDTHYPQSTPWRIVQLRPAMLSSLTSALQNKCPSPQ